jgi:hypothetical protein
MIHYAVLRHGFDISRNPDHLGGSHDESFWLKLGHGGEPPLWLIGNVLWLVSWEGTMKMKHMLYGWYVVEHVGKCQAVISQHTASGNEGCLDPYALGPLDQQPWFLPFVEGQKRFRDGEPTDITPILDHLRTFVRNAGCEVPPPSAAAKRTAVTVGV